MIVNKLKCPVCGNIIINKDINDDICLICGNKMNFIDKLKIDKEKYNNFEITKELYRTNPIYYPIIISNHNYNNFLFVLFIKEDNIIKDILVSDNQLYSSENTYSFDMKTKKFSKLISLDYLKDNNYKCLEIIINVKDKIDTSNNKLTILNDLIIENLDKLEDKIRLFKLIDKKYINEVYSNVFVRTFLLVMNNTILYEGDRLNDNIFIYLNGIRFINHPNIEILEFSVNVDKHIAFDYYIKINTVQEKLRKKFINEDLDNEELWYKLVNKYYDENSNNNELIESCNLYLTNKKTNEYDSIIRLMKLINEDSKLVLNIITDNKNFYKDSFLSIIENSISGIAPVAKKLDDNVYYEKPIKVINSMGQGFIDEFPNLDEFKDNTLNYLNYDKNKYNLVSTEISEMFEEHLIEFITENKKNNFIKLFDRYKNDNSLLLNESILEEETKTISSKRKKAENLIYKVISSLDKSNENTNYYKSLFGKMMDEQFKRYIKKMENDEDENFFIEVLPNKNEPTLKDIKEALNILNVPLDEYVYYRHDGHEKDPIRTRYKVPVGYLIIKRVQQFLSKKNTYSLDISQRSMKTNQVTGKSKISRISDGDNNALSAIGADFALKEFMGPRADSSDAKIDMYRDISLYGYVYQKDLSNNLNEKQTLNTVNVYLTGAGFETDLLEPLPKSVTDDMYKEISKLTN